MFCTFLIWHWRVSDGGLPGLEPRETVTMAVSFFLLRTTFLLGEGDGDELSEDDPELEEDEDDWAAGAAAACAF